MPAPKTLAQHVRDGTYRSRRHHELLVGPVLPWPELAALQSRYLASGHELERRAIGVEFERAVQRLEGILASVTLRERLRELFDAPPELVDLEQDQRRSERFARKVYARDLRADGLSLRQIGERLGVSRSTVRRDLEEDRRTRGRLTAN